MLSFRGKIAGKYILFEIIPGFVIGAIVFVLVLLMFQSLRLTEFVIVHGVSLKVILNIVTYMSVSFLPAILPMSILFAMLLSYSRLSSDSEIVVMKSVGLSNWSLILPGLIFSIFIAFVSAYTSFYLAPWGNRQFEVLFTKLANQKVAATIREGAFSEGFFDLVVYAKKVNSKKGILENIFIYDERNEQQPLTIIAKRGDLVKTTGGHSDATILRLSSGDIHRTSKDAYTKISFDTYDILFQPPMTDSQRSKSFPSYTMDDLKEELGRGDLDAKKRRLFEAERAKRWAIAFTCIVFTLLAIGIGAVTHHRSGHSGGLVYSISIIVLFWALYVGGDSLVQNTAVPVVAAIWIPNIIFLLAAIWKLRVNWN